MEEERLSLFTANNGTPQAAFVPQETESSTYLKMRMSKNESIGWAGLLAGRRDAWRFVDMENQQPQINAVSFGNALLLGCHHSGKVLFCYNDCCQGRELYGDLATGDVKYLGPKVRTMPQQQKVPLPLQTVQLRFDPLSQSAVLNDNQQPLANTQQPVTNNEQLYTNLDAVRIVDVATKDLTDATDPQLRRYIPKMVHHYLRPIPLHNVDYSSGGRCNVLSFWKVCKVTNAIMLYCNEGSAELLVTDMRFGMHLRALDHGLAIFIGVQAQEEPFPDGRVLTWGDNESFFTLIRNQEWGLYSNLNVSFQMHMRLDYPGNFFVNVTDIKAYAPQTIHTITDLLLIQTRLIPQTGPIPIEETWFAKVAPQTLGSGFAASPLPVVIVRLYIRYQHHRLLKGTDSEDAKLRGNVYHICNVACDGCIASLNNEDFHGEVICQLTGPKQHVELCRASTAMKPLERAYLKKYLDIFTPIVQGRIEALDKEFQAKQQCQTPQVKPRRTLLVPTPTRTPYTPMHSDNSFSASPTPARSSTNALSGTISDPSPTQASRDDAIVIQDEEPVDQTPLLPIRRRGVPIFDDDDDLHTVALLGLTPPQPIPLNPNPTDSTAFLAPELAELIEESARESESEAQANSLNRKRHRANEGEDEETPDESQRSSPTWTSSSNQQNEETSDESKSSSSTSSTSDSSPDEIEKFIFGSP